MTAKELQEFVRLRIPVAEFMQVSVISAEPECVAVAAPLAPNMNVHGTFFGGSAAAIGLIAAWSLVFLRMRSANLGTNLVVRSHHMSYLRPVHSEVIAKAQFHSTHSWADFTASLERKGRGRVAVDVSLSCAGQVCAQLAAEFAAASSGA